MLNKRLCFTIQSCALSGHTHDTKAYAHFLFIDGHLSSTDSSWFCNINTLLINNDPTPITASTYYSNVSSICNSSQTIGSGYVKDGARNTSGKTIYPVVYIQPSSSGLMVRYTNPNTTTSTSYANYKTFNYNGLSVTDKVVALS